MIFILLFTLAIALFCINRWTSYKKFYRQGLNGPFKVPIFGNSLYVLFRPFKDYEAENFKKFGDTYVDFMFDSNGIIVTSNQKYIKKILIKDFPNFIHRLQPTHLQPFARKAVIFLNEDWKRVRSQITPVFSSGRIKLMFKKFNGPIQTCLNNIDELIDLKQGELINAKKLMRAYALDMIANVVFSLKTNTFKEDDFSKLVTKLFQATKLKFLIQATMPKFLVQFLKITSMNKESVAYFAKLAQTLIEERKKKKDLVYNDFIELLLKSEAEGEVIQNYEEDGHIVKKLSHEEIIGQAFIFFAAGLETVGTVLSLLLYELSLNQDIQNKLYKDLMDCYPNDEITFDDISKSKYLDCVINETLRKHTTVNRVFRKAASDYDFGEFMVKKGQIMAISLENLHHDPKIYKDPHKYIPERFENSEITNNVNGIVFAPFLDGPRNCIGNRFALIEMKSLIIKLIKNFRVFATDKTEIPVAYEKTVNLNIVKSLTLGFERRVNY